MQGLTGRRREWPALSRRETLYQFTVRSSRTQRAGQRESSTTPGVPISSLGRVFGANTPRRRNQQTSRSRVVDGKWVNMRVPYPSGSNQGNAVHRKIPTLVEGRGILPTYGQRTPFHSEGGKGTLPEVVKVPDRRSAGRGE